LTVPAYDLKGKKIAALVSNNLLKTLVVRGVANGMEGLVYQYDQEVGNARETVDGMLVNAALPTESRA
jgi:hypothetical protein